MTSRHAGLQGSARRGTRAAFRAWRRSRPFWGGLLLLLAGLELLAIPLSGVLIKGQVKLVIYIGIGGVFGVLIGALLIAAGIVVWVNPTHRVFYGIAGVVLGVLSFPASNLGGFFLGMLLAIIGGALAFAWTPSGPEPAAGSPGFASAGRGPGFDGTVYQDTAYQDSAYRDTAGTRVDLPALMEGDWPGDDQPRRRPGTGGSGFGPGYRLMALAGLPCVLGVFCTSSPSSSPSPAASGTASPSASPSPSPSSSSGSGLPGLLPTPSASSGGKTGPLGGLIKSAASKAAASTKTATKKSGPVNQVQAPSGLVAPSTTSVLTAKSSTMKQFNFVGITTLPVGGGGSEKVLEFNASSASLSAVGISVTQDGKTVLTKTTSVDMPAGMTLYTTKLCGQVAGILPNVCFTPSTASAVALKLASILGKTTPITMTNVTADQFLNQASTSQWGALNMATVS